MATPLSSPGSGVDVYRAEWQPPDDVPPQSPPQEYPPGPSPEEYPPEQPETEPVTPEEEPPSPPER